MIILNNEINRDLPDEQFNNQSQSKYFENDRYGSADNDFLPMSRFVDDDEPVRPNLAQVLD
jgi:hypothetical protein